MLLAVRPGIGLGVSTAPAASTPLGAAGAPPTTTQGRDNEDPWTDPNRASSTSSAKIRAPDDAILSTLCEELEIDRAAAEAILTYYDTTPDMDEPGTCE